MNFQATLKSGGFDFGSEQNAQRFKEYARKNVGKRVDIKPYLPESDKMRRWFEGALIPLVTFYQENMDHRDAEDNRKVREWLKLEFNAEIVNLKGKAHKIPGSTKYKLNDGLVEHILDWMGENGYQIEYTDPSLFKKWRDEVRGMTDGPDNYIDYLVETGKLAKSR